MTRAAVAEAFERFLDRTLAAVYEEFDVVAALGGATASAGPAAGLVDDLLKRSDALERRVVRPELRGYRRTVCDQFGVVLDYAADPGAGFEAYADEVLATDLYVRSLRADAPQERREALRERVLARNRRVGEHVRPLVAAEADAFWPAVGATFGREEAVGLVEETFRFTGPAVAHRDVLAFRAEVDPADLLGGPASLLGDALPTLAVEFTDEAIEAMRRGERRVVDRVQSETRRRYDDGDFEPAGPSRKSF